MVCTVEKLGAWMLYGMTHFIRPHYISLRPHLRDCLGLDVFSQNDVFSPTGLLKIRVITSWLSRPNLLGDSSFFFLRIESGCAKTNKSSGSACVSRIKIATFRDIIVLPRETNDSQLVAIAAVSHKAKLVWRKAALRHPRELRVRSLTAARVDEEDRYLLLIMVSMRSVRSPEQSRCVFSTMYASQGPPPWKRARPLSIGIL